MSQNTTEADATGVTKFQYEKSYRSLREDLLGLLQKHGELGWEAILIEKDYVYWKRELTPAVQALEAAAREKFSQMRSHLHHDHGHTVYVGDVFEIHTESFPDCELTAPIA